MDETTNPQDKPLVLVVEDEPDINQALQRKLRVAGMQVLSAKDGEEGLRMAQHNPVQLIVLDVLMPKMGGMTMAHHLREHEVDIPILVLTNLESTSIPDYVRGMMVKANVSLDEVVDKVRQILNLN